MVKAEKLAQIEDKARDEASRRLLEILAPYPKKQRTPKNPFDFLFSDEKATEQEDESLKNRVDSIDEQRAILEEKLRRQELENETVEIEVEDSSIPMLEVFSDAGMEQMGLNFNEMLGSMFPKKKKKRKVSIREARQILAQQEAEKMIDFEEVKSTAVRKAEETGIVFLDEIDKICGYQGKQGPDVSREGVQRDILPMVEGSTVMTKYGPVKSDHVLFIAAGAFHTSKPSDLIPELQGRFPIRVELSSLRTEDFEQILTEPENSLIKLYSSLLATEGHGVTFTEEAIKEIARIANKVNSDMEDIGARRLHTILEKLFEDLFFEAPEMEAKSLVIDATHVSNKLKDIIESKDLTRYIL